MDSATAAAEARARALVAHYAASVHIRPPSVLFTGNCGGPCYEALPHRIDIDEGTLALPDALMRAVIAHEVGHATQRKALLLDLGLTALALGVLIAIAIACLLFAAPGSDELWRVSVPGAGLLLTLAALMRAARPRVTRRILELELDADAKAARLCGAASTIRALEQRSNHTRFDTARLEALRALSAELTGRVSSAGPLQPVVRHGCERPGP
jgi:Zn-dependent protease with chaperone function